MTTGHVITNSHVQRFCPFKGLMRNIVVFPPRDSGDPEIKKSTSTIHQQHLLWCSSRQTRGTQFNQAEHPSLSHYFTHIRFSSADFSRAHVTVIKEVACTNSRFDHCVFKGGRIDKFSATGCSFREADFSSASFSNSWSLSTFNRCSLLGASFQGCTRADTGPDILFTSCDLRGVRWDHSLVESKCIRFNHCCFSPDALPWLQLRKDWKSEVNRIMIRD
jgi:hypothetical protein